MTCRPTDVRKSCVIKKLVYDATFQEKKGIGTDIGNIIPIITSQYRQPQVSRYHRKKKKKKRVFLLYYESKCRLLSSISLLVRKL